MAFVSEMHRDINGLKRRSKLVKMQAALADHAPDRLFLIPLGQQKKATWH